MAHLVLLFLIVFHFLAVSLFLLLLLLLFQQQNLLDLFRRKLLIDHFLLGWEAIFFDLLLAALDLQITFLFLFLTFFIAFFNYHSALCYLLIHFNGFRIVIINNDATF